MTPFRSRGEKRPFGTRTKKSSPPINRHRRPTCLSVERLEDRWLPSFTLTVIDPPGGNESQAYSININGQVVGKANSTVGGPSSAYVWDNGVYTDIGASLFGGASIAYDINDSGNVTGDAKDASGVSFAYFWSPADPNNPIPIGPFNGAAPGSHTVGNGINNFDVIIGNGFYNSTVSHGFRWTPGDPHDFDDLGAIAIPSSFAFDINNAGTTVGASATSATPFHAVTATPTGNFQVLGPNGTLVGGAGSTAVAINDHGVIVGKAKIGDVAGPHHLFIWQNGQIIDLGTLPSEGAGNRSSTPYRISNSGIIVGDSDVDTGIRHGFVYFNGAMYNLNDLIPDESGFVIKSATGVNEKGQIVGNGGFGYNGDGRAYVLTPNAVRLQVSAVPNTSAGAPFDLTVTALDMFGNAVPGYTGTVNFSSTDWNASLPGEYTFTTNDEGVHTFNNLTMSAAGTQSIQVVDTLDNTLTSIVDVAVSGASINRFQIAIPANAVAGAPVKITVMALDEFGNTSTNYNGTVHFFTSDPQGVVPADSLLTNGVGSFTVTMKTSGFQNFIVNDVINTNLFGVSGVVAVDPAAAASFDVFGPGVSRAGKRLTFTIQAVDAFGNLATGYTGNVHVTSSDVSAVLPANTTLTHGSGTVEVTLRTTGLRTVTATDTANPTITGTSNNVNVVPSQVTDLDVAAPATVTAGVPFSITVTARDPYGNVVDYYTGPAKFSSTDGQAVLPPDSLLTNGVGTFSITLKTSGNHGISATHVDSNSITSNTTVTVNPAAATRFNVTLPTVAKSGTAFTLTVTAQDAFGNTATSYPGTVTFSSNDPVAVLPSNSTLPGGSKTFSVTLNTNGTRSITVTDIGNPTINGSSSTSVGTTFPTGAASFAVSIPGTAVAGVPVTVTVTALDAGSNVATGYTGTVTFTSNDPQAVLPANVTLVDGVGTFTVVLRTAGSRKVTVADTVNGSIIGTSNSALISASAVTHLQVAVPGTMTAGTPFSATLSALDIYGNLVTSGTIVVRLSSTDAQAVLPANAVLVNGTAIINVTLKTVGAHSIVAKAAGSSLQGQGVVTVNPSTVAKFGVTLPAEVVAGMPFSITVSALDTFNNVVPSYAGQVHFTSNDAQAVLPANSTLNNGTRSFTVTLKTGDVHSITVNDTVNGSLNGTSNTMVDPGAAVQFNVTGGTAPAGSVVIIIVEAVDAFGNLATGYTGVINFTSSDGQAALPSNATLTNGAGIYGVVMKTAGNQSFTATDTLNPAITGATNVTVNPAAAVQLVVSAPSSATAGDVLSVTVTALDAYGNVATDYNGTIFFAGNDYQAIFPADAPLANGSQTFQVTLKTAGARTIAVTDLAHVGISGADAVNIVAGPMTKFLLTTPPSSPKAGQQFTMPASARDAFGNFISSYNGTVNFTSSDPNAILPPNGSPVTNGIATFSFTIFKALQQTVTVTDSVNSALTDVAGFPIKPADVTQYVITGPSSATAGVPFDIVIEAQDQYGNWNAQYVPQQPANGSKTACLSSSDPLAQFPACVTFTFADLGRKTVSVTLNTIGTQTVTAVDQSNSSIDGTISIQVNGRMLPAPTPGQRVARRSAPTPKVVPARVGAVPSDAQWKADVTPHVYSLLMTADWDSLAWDSFD